MKNIHLSDTICFYTIKSLTILESKNNSIEFAWCFIFNTKFHLIFQICNPEWLKITRNIWFLITPLEKFNITVLSFSENCIQLQCKFSLYPSWNQLQMKFAFFLHEYLVIGIHWTISSILYNAKCWKTPNNKYFAIRFTKFYCAPALVKLTNSYSYKNMFKLNLSHYSFDNQLS